MRKFFFSDADFDHNSPNQQTRRKSALNLEVLEINREHSAGIINDYDVSLEHCSCRDFKLRNAPCKHMYRLAHELGLIKLDGQINNVNQRKIKDAIKEEVSALSDSMRYKLNSIINASMYDFEFVSQPDADIIYLIDNSFAVEVDSIDALANFLRKDFLVETLRKNQANIKIKGNSSKLELLEHLKFRYPAVYEDIFSSVKILKAHDRLIPHLKSLYRLTYPPSILY